MNVQQSSPSGGQPGRCQVLPCGERAALVELPGLEEVLRVDAVLRELVDGGRAPWDRVVDVVPAARTVLVTVAAAGELAPVARSLPYVMRRALRDASPDGTAGGDEGHVVEIPVRYDGPDLAEVAELTSLSADDVVDAHTGGLWRVAFGGFAPGFAYLAGGDARLDVPRRAEPRTSVPPGAVGLAGPFSGVYPRSSPGGWQLIGSTSMVLWDERRDPPALLRPGWRVRFVRERPR